MAAREKSITEEELDILNMLGDAYNLATNLPELHAFDNSEFARAIHQAQNIILARGGKRALDIESR